MSGEPRESPPPAPRTSRLLGVEESLRLQSIFLALARLTKTLLAIAVPIVLVRTLDTEVWGHYKVIGLLTATALHVLSLGIPGSLYYFVPRAPRASQSLMLRSTMILGVAGLAGGVAIALAGGWLERYLAAPLGDYRLPLAAIVALSVPGSLAEVLAVVDRRARLSALVVAGLEVLRSALVVTVALTVGRLGPVLVAMTAGFALQVAAGWIYLVWRGRQDGEDTLPFRTLEQFRYTLPFFGASLVGLARNYLHAYFVAAQYTDVQFGIYALGTLSIPFVDKLTQSVAEVVVIDASRRHGEGDVDEVRRVWWRATAMIALVLMPIFAAFEVFAPEIIVFVAGSEEFRPAAGLFRIFVVTLPLAIPLSSAMLRSSANLRTLVWADVVSLVATIAVLLAAARPLGLHGAVLSLIAGALVFHVVAALRIGRELGIGPRRYLPWGRIAAVTAVAFASAGLAAVAVSPFSLAARAVGGPALSLALCGAVLWVTPLVPDSERELVRQIARSAIARLGRRRRPGGPGDV